MHIYLISPGLEYLPHTVSIRDLQAFSRSMRKTQNMPIGKGSLSYEYAIFMLQRRTPASFHVCFSQLPEVGDERRSQQMDAQQDTLGL